MAIARRPNGQFRAEVSVGGRKRTIACATREEAVAAEQQLKAEQRKAKAAARAALEQQKIENLAQADLPEHSLGHFIRICLARDWLNVSKNRREDALLMGRRLGMGVDVRKIDLAVREAFVDELRGRWGCSDARILHYMSLLDVVLKRAVRMGVISAIPLAAEGLKAKPVSEMVLKAEWINTLVEELSNQRDYGSPKVDVCQALTLFMYQTAVRASQAVELTWDNVDLSAGTMYWPTTKNGRPQRLPITAEVESILLQARRKGWERPFPITARQFRRKFREARNSMGRKLGLSPETTVQITPHKLRHTCLTELADHGATAFDIMNQANHSDLRMSQRYVHSSIAQMENLRNLKRSQGVQTVQF